MKLQKESLKLTVCPYTHKYELVHWLCRYHDWLYTKANKLRKKQLYAIWYNKNKDKQ